MTNQTCKKQVAKDWFFRMKEIQEQIADINRKIGVAPDISRLAIPAGDAKRRLESFVYLNGDQREENIPDRLQGELRTLKNNVAETAEALEKYKKQSHQLIEERDELKKRLDGTFRQTNLELSTNFSADGLKEFVESVVEIWLDSIKTIKDKLSHLEEKRSELKSEVKSFRPKTKNFNEDELLNASIKDLTAELKAEEELKRRQKAAEELFNQAEAAVKAVQKRLEAERKQFADDLTDAVAAYTNAGIFNTAQDLKLLLKKDSLYHEAVSEICRELLKKTGTDAAHVFNFTGGSLPAQTHIISDSVIRGRLESMVDEILKQNRLQTTD